jgi:hypothetical protein
VQRIYNYKASLHSDAADESTPTPLRLPVRLCERKTMERARGW